ncbi:hypothetical protein BH09BAC5_BH09BAC5_21820 [soil metagenome]
MKKIWDSISNCGVAFTTSAQERNTVQLINRMSLLLAWIMVMFSLLSIVDGMLSILFFSVSFSLGFALPIFLQKIGWLKFAKAFFTFSPLLGITAIGIYNSADMGDKFFFITTSTIPVILYKHKGQRYLFFMFSVIGFYFIWWYQNHFEPVKVFSVQQQQLYWGFALLSVFAIIYYVLQYFRAGNEDYQKELEFKNDIIEEKNKDILSSIHYAKRIQRALLASDKLLNDKLPEHFILYKPKDIVSGDFYWADEIADGKFLILAGDCTGHGVPGAFMSLLNISIIHELTLSQRITRPDLLLNKQRDAIIMALNPDGAEEVSKDGMDCVVCSFDFANKKLEFACANNPLWILRNGAIMEYKADKMPIGIHAGEMKDFTLHKEDLIEGDIVYLLTDGFADQFGGPKGKKFKYNQLKEMLITLAGKKMDEQKSAMENIFESWKGKLEQVDDVLLIGIKI